MERDSQLSVKMSGAVISTHTLTWSVTCKDDTVRIAGENFNSHAHVERDNAGEEVKVRFVNFNSQAHVERDQGMERRIIMTKISTHTLTWSVTRSSAGRPDRTEYFNSHAHVERD